jgi:hypothetical protein
MKNIYSMAASSSQLHRSAPIVFNKGCADTDVCLIVFTASKTIRHHIGGLFVCSRHPVQFYAGRTTVSPPGGGAIVTELLLSDELQPVLCCAAIGKMVKQTRATPPKHMPAALRRSSQTRHSASPTAEPPPSRAPPSL